MKNQKTKLKIGNPNSKIKTLTSDHKAITLIALIITIIVMLILVGVTITVALKEGLFTTAKKAASDTESERTKEETLSTGRVKIDGIWYDSIEKYIAKEKSNDQNDIPSKWGMDAEGNITYDGKVADIKIGDYVDYTPDSSTYESSKLGSDYTGYNNTENLTTEELNWRVLGVDEQGRLTLISDKPTSKTVYFKNAVGYNNGVYILNDICEKLYSNTTLGIKARSLTIEDIEAGFSNDGGIKARNEYKNSNSNTQYGKTNATPYTTNKQYPIIYKEEKGSGIDNTTVRVDGIGGSEPYYTEAQLTAKPGGKEIDTASDSLTCTQTYYEFESTPKNYCKKETFYDMIFGTNTYYWLASRYVDCYSSFAGFGLRFVYYSNLSCDYLFGSDGYPDNAGNYLRPAVSLGSDIKVTRCEGENNESNKHTLSKVGAEG